MCYNILAMTKTRYFSNDEINTQLKELLATQTDIKYLRYDDTFFKIALGDNMCHITLIHNGNGFTRLYYKDAQMSGGSVNAELFGELINLILQHNVVVEDVLHPQRGNEMACSVHQLILNFYNKENNFEEEEM